MGSKEYKRVALTCKLLGLQINLDKVAEYFLKAASCSDDNALNASIDVIWDEDCLESSLACQIAEDWIWGAKKKYVYRKDMAEPLQAPVMYYGVYCALLAGCINAEDIQKCLMNRQNDA